MLNGQTYVDLEELFRVGTYEAMTCDVEISEDLEGTLAAKVAGPIEASCSDSSLEKGSHMNTICTETSKDHLASQVVLSLSFIKMLTSCSYVAKKLPDHTNSHLKERLHQLLLSHSKLLFGNSKPKNYINYVTDSSIKYLLSQCGNVLCQAEEGSCSSSGRRTVILQEDNTVTFPVQNAALGDEDLWSFHLSDEETGNEKGWMITSPAESTHRDKETLPVARACIWFPEEGACELKIGKVNDDEKSPQIWTLPDLENIGSQCREQESDGDTDGPFLSSLGEPINIEEDIISIQTEERSLSLSTLMYTDQPSTETRYCPNCKSQSGHCLDGKPVVPFQANLLGCRVVSHGPYWGAKKRDQLATIVDIFVENGVNSEKGGIVKVRWDNFVASSATTSGAGGGPHKKPESVYNLKSSLSHAMDELIFVFRCEGRPCDNCKQPGSNCLHGKYVTVCPVGCSVITAGPYWSDKKRNKQGTVVEFCPSMEIVPEEVEPRAMIRVKSDIGVTGFKAEGKYPLKPRIKRILNEEDSNAFKFSCGS